MIKDAPAVSPISFTGWWTESGRPATATMNRPNISSAVGRRSQLFSSAAPASTPSPLG